MMRSLYSGVAGLKTHQTKMDVIGNNIANVNTTAFKSSSIVFSDLMSQTTQKASGPNAATGRGGINARQIGLGVKSGAININITGQGSAQSTGNPFDLMISGENFFVVNNGVQNVFTRDGSFYVDSAGNLAMTSTGYNVMGWQVDPETGDIRQDTVTALRIMNTANMTYPPEATSEAYMTGILDRDDTDVTSKNGKVVNMNFFDALGYEYTARFVFRQSDDENEFSLELEKILDSNGDEVEIPEGSDLESLSELLGGSRTQAKNGVVYFDNVGYKWVGNQLQKSDGTVVVADVTAATDEEKDALAAAYGYEGATEEFLNLLYSATPDNPGTLDEGMSIRNHLAELPNWTTDDDPTFQTVGRAYNGNTVRFNGDSGIFDGIDGNPTNTDVTLNLSQLGGNFSDITIDLSEITIYGNKGTSTVSAITGSNDADRLGEGAGRRLGDMIGVSIQTDGRIYASYDNGMTKLLGQIATASFANAAGLEKQGDNLYAATLNSGEFDGVGVDITANGGSMTSGQLEMSNVDLSSEFTEMITTQRGFQANSRIITVSDTLLEELTNLKR